MNNACGVRFRGYERAGNGSRKHVAYVVRSGADDNVYARLSRPTLTTVRQSPTDKGREAVKLLLKRVYGQEVMVGSMELPTELIVRESVRNIWKQQNVV